MDTIVISIGGSIIVPDDIDVKFLNKLKEALLRLSEEHKLVVCCGGGYTARAYITALKEAGASNAVQDWMGIEVTRINARLVASFIGNANDVIPRSEDEVAALLEHYSIVVCGGLRPGQTSDGATAMIALRLKAKRMINMTNVDGLYDKDPRKYKNAKFIPEISHTDFLKMMEMVGQKPGQHFVLDKVAAEIAASEGMEVCILKGVENLDKCILGKKFKGTIVH